MKVQFRNWILDCDPDATKRSYQEEKEYYCSCEGCRNFVLAREKIHPEEVLVLFAKLGIDPHKESEVFRSNRDKAGSHEYGGWFLFTGSILSGKDAYEAIAENAWSVVMEHITDNFSIGFTNHVALLPRGWKGENVTQLEFWASKVPWLLPSPPPD